MPLAGRGRGPLPCAWRCAKTGGLHAPQPAPPDAARGGGGAARAMAAPSASAAAALVKLCVTIPAGAADERRVVVLRPADAAIPDVISSAYRDQARAAARSAAAPPHCLASRDTAYTADMADMPSRRAPPPRRGSRRRMRGWRCAWLAAARATSWAA